MDIKLSKLGNVNNWIRGLVDGGEFYFEAKIYDEGSICGINEGRVSKLSIWLGNSWKGFDGCIVSYDKGWSIEPESEFTDVYEEVLSFLENIHI